MLDQFTTVAEGLDHPEGVAWSPRGYLYAGGEAGQIYRVTLDGRVETVASTSGFVLGVTVDGGDHVYACDPDQHAVLRVDPRTGAVDVYSSGTDEHPLRTPNYSCFDPAGALYFTDSGTWDQDDGLVFRVHPDGTTQSWCDATSAFPNGCCMSGDQQWLYVVESTRPGVSRIPILPDGSAGPPELVVETPGAVPDGIALDTRGTLWISCYRPDRIYRFTADGRLDVFAEDPRGTVLAAPTNIAFSGPDLGVLVVANLGRWHLSSIPADVPGISLHYPDLS